MKLLFLLLFCGIWQCGFGDNEDVEINTNFVVKVKPFVDSALIPNFVRKIILEKYDQYELNATDVFTTIGIDEIGLNETYDILDKANIPRSTFFSVEYVKNLKEAINIDTNVLIDGIRRNLDVYENRTAKKLFLEPVQVSLEDYSDSYEYNKVFFLTNGIYTEATLTEATERINKTLDHLFRAIRDTFTTFIIKKIDINNFGTLDNVFPDATLTRIVNTIKIKLNNIYAVPTFDGLLREAHIDLDDKNLLGALTGENKVTINTHTFAQWEKWIDIVKIMVNSATPGLYSFISNAELTQRALNAFELKTNVKIDRQHVIKPRKTDNHLENCTYLTLDRNGNLVVDFLPELSNDGDYFLYNSSDNTANFVLGSPLVCGKHLYGLESKSNSTYTIFDALYDEDDDIFIPPDYSAGQSIHPELPIIVSMGLFLCVPHI